MDVKGGTVCYVKLSEINIGHTGSLRHSKEKLQQWMILACWFYAKVEMQFLSSEILLLKCLAFISERFEKQLILLRNHLP